MSADLLLPEEQAFIVVEVTTGSAEKSP